MSQQRGKTIPIDGDDRNKLRSGAEMYIYRRKTWERIKHIAGFPPSTCLVCREGGGVTNSPPSTTHTPPKEPQFFTARNCSAQPIDRQRTGLFCYRGILLRSQSLAVRFNQLVPASRSAQKHFPGRDRHRIWNCVSYLKRNRIHSLLHKLTVSQPLRAHQCR